MGHGTFGAGPIVFVVLIVRIAYIPAVHRGSENNAW